MTETQTDRQTDRDKERWRERETEKERERQRNGKENFPECKMVSLINHLFFQFIPNFGTILVYSTYSIHII